MSRLALVAFALVLGCGDNTSNGPFDELPLDAEFTLGLFHPVHVARDTYGVAHISGQNVADVAFVQGYVMAHDRLPQMDILRRFGAGTLAELFGALDPSVIDTDLEMRMHRMKPLARESWAALQASNDPVDKDLVVLLQRFADGVNAYAHAIRSDQNPSGLWDLDPNLLASFDPHRFVDWDPVDSLVLGRFQAFALSWSTPFEIDLTELYQKLRATYDNAAPAATAAYARRGITRDLIKFTPVGTKPTIDGFPNVATDSGSRSDGGASGRARPHPAGALPTGAPPAGAIKRPIVSQQLFDQAHKLFGRGIRTGPFGALGPHAFMHPYAGSNNWAVGPTMTASGVAMLATDQHLQLPNPSIFYPTHLIITPDGIADPNGGEALASDVLGVTFPGIPGVILGSNGKVAWSATVSEHDVNDVYLETIAPCAADATKSCAMSQAGEQPIETFQETIKIGALGTITGEKLATYEVVPRHGPILPTITNHAIVPRTAATAMSVKYTGYVPTFEIRALWKLGHAQTVKQGFQALADFTYGSQNWTMIDNAGSIGWTTNAVVPNRDPRVYQWNAVTNPDGLAPFLVLPGDGTAEWQDPPMSPRYVPHGIDPSVGEATGPVKGFFATANADPVGATFDGDPLNQPIVDGRPLYAGVTYAAGVREERITTLLEGKHGQITLDDMEAIQHDTHSNVGEKLVPPVLAALVGLDSTAGMPTDVMTYLAALPAADRTRLTTARDLLVRWQFETPTGLDATGAQHDSAATVVFNTWMHFFLERSIKDELDQVVFDVWRLDDNILVRIAYALLTDPGSFVQSPDTHQPVLCDRIGTAGADDSCTKIILQALVDAMTHLESSTGFATADTTQWNWGKLHRLKITPLFPNTALDLPGPGLPGFPKAGDNFVINRADQGWGDLDFSQFADGPAQRFLATAEYGSVIKVKWALPGGVIYDSRSPHYRDLLDNYYLPLKHFDAPYEVKDINHDGESRWLFH